MYDVKDGGWIDNKEATYYIKMQRLYGDNTTAPYDVAKDIIMTRKRGSRLRISADIKDVNIDLSFLTQESYYNGSNEPTY